MFRKSAQFCTYAQVKRMCGSRVEEHTHELRQKTSTKIRLHNKHVCGCSLAIQCIFVQRSAKNIHKLISLRFVGSFHIQAFFLKNVRIITHSSRVSWDYSTSFLTILTRNSSLESFHRPTNFVGNESNCKCVEYKMSKNCPKLVWYIKWKWHQQGQKNILRVLRSNRHNILWKSNLF